MTEKQIKQPKQKKCRITEQELQKRFIQADLNGDGTLSADQITTLLQSIGFQDTYKGTIRKICRYLNKQKQLKQSRLTAQAKTKLQTKSKQLPQQQQQSVVDQEHKNETQEQKKLRKQQQKRKQQQEAAITFQQFRRYFQILDKPVGKILYNALLERSVIVAALCQQFNMKNMFHTDKGQSLKFNILVGQEKPSYNSSLQIKLQKTQKTKKNTDIFYIDISISTKSPQNATQLVKSLKSAYQMILQLISAQSQQFDQIGEIIQLQTHTQQNIGKIKITTNNQQVKQLIIGYVNTLDEILQTEVKFFINILYRFNFMPAYIKTNPQTAVIEDMFAKDCHFKIQYVGSQFLDAVKQIALTKDVFQILRYDKLSPIIMLLGFLSMEKGNFFMKFNNVQRQQVSRAITQELIGMMGAVNQIQSEQFSLRKISQIVDGPILINVQAQNAKLSVNINIQDILKLPFLLQNSSSAPNYDSD